MKKVFVLITFCFLMPASVMPAAAAAASAIVVRDSKGRLVPQRPTPPDYGLVCLMPDNSDRVFRVADEPRERSTGVSAPSMAALALSPTTRASLAGAAALSPAITEGGDSPQSFEVSYEEQREAFFINFQKRSYQLLLLLQHLFYEARSISPAGRSQLEAALKEMEAKCAATPAPSDAEKRYGVEFKALRDAVWRSLPALPLDGDKKVIVDTRSRLFIDDVAFRLLAAKVNYFTAMLEEAYDYSSTLFVSTVDFEKMFPSPRSVLYEESVYETARYNAGLASRWS